MKRVGLQFFSDTLWLARGNGIVPVFSTRCNDDEHTCRKRTFLEATSETLQFYQMVKQKYRKAYTFTGFDTLDERDRRTDGQTDTPWRNKPRYT